MKLTRFASTTNRVSFLKTTYCFVDLLLRSVNLLHVVLKLGQLNEECHRVNGRTKENRSTALVLLTPCSGSAQSSLTLPDQEGCQVSQTQHLNERNEKRSEEVLQA